MALSDLTSAQNFARKEGLAEGRAEGILEIARKMKARGRPSTEIAEDTGLSIEVIEKL